MRIHLLSSVQATRFCYWQYSHDPVESTFFRSDQPKTADGIPPNWGPPEPDRDLTVTTRPGVEHRKTGVHRASATVLQTGPTLTPSRSALVASRSYMRRAEAQSFRAQAGGLGVWRAPGPGRQGLRLRLRRSSPGRFAPGRGRDGAGTLPRPRFAGDWGTSPSQIPIGPRVCALPVSN